MIQFDKIRNIISIVKKKYPALYFVFYGLWFRRIFRFNRKKIFGKANLIITKNSILNGIKFDIVGDNNSIEISCMAVLDGVTFYIRGNNNCVLIGAECRIADSTIWIEDNMCKVIIGRQTTIGGVHLAATENNSKVVIGEDCMLAYGIDIRTGDSHGIYDEFGERINRAQDVIMGNHVWVAARSIILKGATIGTGSVVATGAVVPRGVYPANCILAGNPAKSMKLGIRWSRSRLDEN